MTIRRRDLLTSLAAGVAGAVVMPGVTDQTVTPSPAASDQATPRLLDGHRRAMLEEIAQEIMPGAQAAGVAALIDRVLAVEPAAAQRRFLNALGAFEREARDRHNKGWTEISSTQRVEILRAASVLPSARPTAPGWTRGQPIEAPSGPPSPPPNLRDHLDHLKDWVQRAYFTTAAGMKEFGFTGAMAYGSFPGCPHPGDVHS